MIEVEQLSKTYPWGHQDAIVVEKGNSQFLGPNGAGKSTTMRILPASYRREQRPARVAGYDIFKDSQVRRRIGYVPENAPLYTDMQWSASGSSQGERPVAPHGCAGQPSHG
jgi:ABC-2 type transport system ATP-binding protein